MTQAAIYAGVTPAPSEPEGVPPVKPRWLSPMMTALVVLAHFAVAVLLMKTAIERPSPVDSSLSLDLVPEGDTMESVEREAMELSEIQPEQVEQQDLAIPPPQLMTPDAIPLPQKQEESEVKKRVEKPAKAVSKVQQDSSQAHQLGVAGGRATGMSRSAYAGLLARAIARHVPSVSSLGDGSASCSFHVGAGGGMAGVSCSGSSASHTSLLRSAIYATHAPPPPGGQFFGSQSVRFH